MAYSSEDTLTGERMKKTLVLVGMDRNLQFNYYAFVFWSENFRYDKRLNATRGNNSKYFFYIAFCIVLLQVILSL